VIKDDLILHTDIPTLNLIYGSMKEKLYETECALHDTHEQHVQDYLEGLMDAYSFVYTEIDRVMNLRGER
jgi:hypothetical protein